MPKIARWPETAPARGRLASGTPQNAGRRGKDGGLAAWPGPDLDD